MPFRWHYSKYKCFYCSNYFIQSSELKDHNATHDRVTLDLTEIVNATKYKNTRIKLDISECICVKCDENVNDFTGFLGHLSKKHELMFDQEILKNFDTFKLSDEGMNCLECGQHFQFFGPLLVHHNKYHIDQYVCEICGQAISGKQNIYNHMFHFHHGVKACRYCGENFTTHYALYNHIGREHRKDDFKCPTCDMQLPNKYMKKRHMALVHNVKCFQIVCEICSKVFTRNNKYIAHKQRVHLKEKNCACEMCGFKAYNEEVLKLHMRRHDDSRPFKCDVCDKGFRRKTNLAQHMTSALHRRNNKH